MNMKYVVVLVALKSGIALCCSAMLSECICFILCGSLLQNLRNSIVITAQNIMAASLSSRIQMQNTAKERMWFAGELRLHSPNEDLRPPGFLCCTYARSHTLDVFLFFFSLWSLLSAAFRTVGCSEVIPQEGLYWWLKFPLQISLVPLLFSKQFLQWSCI